MPIGSVGPSAVQPQSQANRIDTKPSGVMRMLTMIIHGKGSRALDHKENLRVKTENLRVKKEFAQDLHKRAEQQFEARNVSVEQLETRLSACFQKHTELSRRAMASENSDDFVVRAMNALTASEEVDRASEALDDAMRLRIVASTEVASTRQDLHEATTKYETSLRKLGATA